MDVRLLLKGFTLIELLIVIMITSVLSAVVLLQWPGATINLDGQATQLENDVRLTQSLAMSQAVRYCIVFGAANYQIVNSGTSTAITGPLGSSTTTLANGITYGTLVPAGMKMLVFDSKGAPYSSTSTSCTAANAAAATALSANASIPMTTAGVTQNVIVSPETGRAISQ